MVVTNGESTDTNLNPRIKNDAIFKITDVTAEHNTFKATHQADYGASTAATDISATIATGTVTTHPDITKVATDGSEEGNHGYRILHQLPSVQVPQNPGQAERRLGALAR